MEKFTERDSYKKAAEKFERLGLLGVTAEDHREIKSTPPEELEKNPGKTRAELMSDEEITQWLKKQRDLIEEFSQEKYKDNSFAQSYLPDLRKKLELSIRYLKEIGRLPRNFEEERPS
ncbi:MAG: hypothetical protein HYW89_04210 [Candidatus Sungiibacteriota bacterium]|uniref:Uncharacterized protein n=1 Tax=Candidatus Sungiibacteriota bacterium TaxID=2750080 RepID=A0A7T5RJ86_9BACT|nr:MAG: hypothetical protein HYW89_04210 [Candidatus Sungbacteria bacterium]